MPHVLGGECSHEEPLALSGTSTGTQDIPRAVVCGQRWVVEAAAPGAAR